MAVQVLNSSFQDYAYFHRFLRIIDRDTRSIIPLELRREQVALYNQITRLEAAEKPVRIVILKARQIGFSTLIQSLFAHRAFTMRNFHALTVSHEDESTKVLHAMVERMYAELPAAFRRGPLSQDERERGKRLYLKNGSQLRVQTAGGDGDVGRSAGAMAMHLSEAAHYPNPDATALSAFSLVQDQPGTIIVIESTANGEGNWFHRTWLKAVSGESEYTPVFSPWFADPGYQTPLPLDGLGEFDDEERALQAEHGVSLEQLAWRRRMLASPQFDGDVEKFHQEMPSDPEQAFLTSGRSFFRDRIHRFHAVAPLRTGEFVVASAKRGASVVFDADAQPREKSACHLWELPKPGRRYVVTLDPAGGVSDREADDFATPRDAEDYSVITVTDCVTQAEVCTWRDRRDADLVALVWIGIGRIYNDAIISAEDNGGYGSIALKTAQDLGYANLHREQRLNTVTHKLEKRLGHVTTRNTKPMVLAALTETLRDHADLLRDARLKAEMRVFVAGRDGTGQAQSGYHDDLVMSRAWGIHLARLYAQAAPRLSKPKPASRRLKVAA